jgi:hypothetical protein
VKTGRFGPAGAFVLAVVLSLGSAGCGYTLVGSGKSILPPEMKTVYVTTLVNETPVVGVEQRLTDAIILELSARRRLKPVADAGAADAELSGRVTSASLSAVRFDADGRAIEYQLTITARITLVNRATEKPIFDEPSFLFRQPYTVPSSSGTYIDLQYAALEALARPFARTLVTTLLEGF